MLFEEVCMYCRNQTFCEEYGDGDCEALGVLYYLLEQGKITEDDIREYRKKMLEKIAKELRGDD